MRLGTVKKSPWLLTSAVLICGMFANVVAAQPGGAAGPRNLAVLNKVKGGPTDKDWVWRDKRHAASTNNMQGIIAQVRSRATNPKDAVMWIWIYNGVPNQKDPNKGKLELAEKYKVFLTEDTEVNSNRGANKTFHFMVTKNITDAEGEENIDRPGTRTFLITGTRERGNTERTLRITTFTTTPQPPTGGTPATLLPEGSVRTSFTPCTDYPDDAVLDEDEHPLTPSPTSPELEPDPDDPWMDYPWP